MAVGIHDSHSHTLVLIAGDYPEQLIFQALNIHDYCEEFPSLSWI